MKQYQVTWQTEKIPFLFIEKLCDLVDLFPRLMEVPGPIGIDIETMALPEHVHFGDAALCPEMSQARLVQLYTGRTAIVIDCLKCGITETAEVLRPFLSAKKFVAHNAVFELSFFRRAPWHLRDIDIGCSMILGRIINHAVSPDTFPAGLKQLTAAVFKLDLGKEVQASNWGAHTLTYEQKEYAAMDAIATLKLAEYLVPKVQRLGLVPTYQLIKKAQYPIVAMQLQGMKLDIEKHQPLINTWKTELYSAKKAVEQMTGLSSISAAKLGAWLEQNLDRQTLAIWPRTKTEKLATDAHTFSDFSYLPIVKPFERYQKLIKLTTTYGSSLIQDQENRGDRKLHSSFNLTGARTGRLSSSDPNFQNMPRFNSKDRSPQLRQNFVPDNGMAFVCADYSQVELRVAAELSQDAVMLDAYKRGIDLHRLTAAQVSGKKLSDVSADERQMAKAVNFGLLFGLGATKFSHYANKSYGVEVSDDEALHAVATFRKTYAGYHVWQMDQATKAARTLKCRTPTGKLRRLEEGNTYGTAMNHPVQGGAAECMLYALIRLEKDLPTNWKLTNTVHDEILISVPPEDVDKGKEYLRECMTEGFTDVFPGGCTRDLIEAKTGDSWATCK